MLNKSKLTHCFDMKSTVKNIQRCSSNLYQPASNIWKTWWNENCNYLCIFLKLMSKSKLNVCVCICESGWVFLLLWAWFSITKVLLREAFFCCHSSYLTQPASISPAPCLPLCLCLFLYCSICLCLWGGGIWTQNTAEIMKT